MLWVVHVHESKTDKNNNHCKSLLNQFLCKYVVLLSTRMIIKRTDSHNSHEEMFLVLAIQYFKTMCALPQPFVLI